MPYKLIKEKDGTYSVKNMATGAYKSHHIPKMRAEAQIRLLYAIEGKL